MKPTPEQVQAEIKKLKEMKPKVRHHTAFGDDNHVAIEAQIRVMEQGLSSGQIYDRWMDDNLIMSAMDALGWMEGSVGSPSEDWSPLVQE